MNLIDRAALLALEVHDGHHNQHNGEPYVCHLYRAASAALAAGEEDVIVAALWLHDSIEDGKASYTEVVAATNKEVADTVLAMSKTKGESNETYYHRLCGSPKAARAKHYDLGDNFPRNHQLDDDEKRLRMAGKYSMGYDILRDFAPGKPL